MVELNGGKNPQGDFTTLPREGRQADVLKLTWTQGIRLHRKVIMNKNVGVLSERDRLRSAQNILKGGTPT